jgi:hypothetical protein
MAATAPESRALNDGLKLMVVRAATMRFRYLSFNPAELRAMRRVSRRLS